MSAAGKTTLLRDIASILSDKLNKYVMVIDSNNEIGGNGSISHQSLGGARRMPVHDRASQHETMLQAALNHKPEVRPLC
jgi:stage III sporulation protein SpoIIIAA